MTFIYVFLLSIFILCSVLLLSFALHVPFLLFNVLKFEACLYSLLFLSNIPRFTYLLLGNLEKRFHLSQFCFIQNDVGISLSNKLSTGPAPSSQSITTRLDSFEHPPLPPSSSRVLWKPIRRKCMKKIYINFNMPP